ncbi:MAG: class I SAM-dependent methyltransferase [Pirellulales bacterium]
MFAADQYELLDFGAGRKLERFGRHVLDRPCPAAEGLDRAAPTVWQTAAAKYERFEEGRGEWRAPAPLAPWPLEQPPFQLELRLTDQGQVGVFPEQAANWEWLAQRLAAAPQPLRVLNLFAYTGGSTLAAAAAGCEVSHVDAAATSVAWARRNALASGLEGAPVRWLVEDALTFVRRELKRGRSYDAVILDPPSYGHGPKGQPWKLSEKLPELLGLCAQLTAGRLQALLLTCHTPGFTPRVLADLVQRTWDECQARPPFAGELNLVDRAGRALPSGVVVRWPA